MREIQLRNTNSELSMMVDDAVSGEPTVIIRNGKREAVILSYQKWEHLSQFPSFGHLLMNTPISSDDLSPRDTASLRQTEF